MREMSERVEREFKEWQEKYEIELFDEYDVKTLLTLREQFDNIDPNLVKTRRDLLEMMHSLKMRLRIKPKGENTVGRKIDN